MGGVSHLRCAVRYPIDRGKVWRGPWAAPFFLCSEWLDSIMQKSILANVGVLAGLAGLADDDDRFTRRMTTKRIGEVSEAALALKARTMGFMVVKPWGDSELYDLILPATHSLQSAKRMGHPAAFMELQIVLATGRRTAALHCSSRSTQG